MTVQTTYMRTMRRVCIAVLGVLTCFVFAAGDVAAQTGKITGRVIDVTTADALPGANVRIEGTTRGAATDIDGAFVINGVPAGQVPLVASYLGYEPTTLTVDVPAGGTAEVEIRLEPTVLEGEDVVVTAQVQGQRQAINQQITSLTPKNVVSAAKIRELPEANAAEAVGRLPGVTLQREGGEGTKVVIRGLSPKYNKIQMEGVSMASTDPNDRSTDLSMISPYMLDGIEVTKAATADQEADQLGGTVNFRLREAPSGLTVNAVAQGGYNGLRDELSDYKFVLSGSNRFFGDKLGFFANVDVEHVNRGANEVFATYSSATLTDPETFLPYDTVAVAQNTTFQDTERVKNRYGGSVVLDYQLPLTQVKLFTTYNRVDEEETVYNEMLDPFADSRQYLLDDSRDELSALTAKLDIEQTLGGLQLSASGSYTYSQRVVPDGVQLRAVEAGAFVDGYDPAGPQDISCCDGMIVDEERGLGFLHPSEFIRKANSNLEATNVDWLWSYDSEVFQDQYAVDLSAEYELTFSDGFSVDLEAGGMYRHQSRENDYNSYEHALTYSTVNPVRQLWAQALQGNQYLDGYQPTNPNFPFLPFVDQGFDSEEFFDGQLNVKLDPDMARRYVEMVERTTEGSNVGLQLNYNASIPEDYTGTEDYYAAYFMPTIRVGSKLTLIPGVRYEVNRTEYTGVRTQALGQWDESFAYDEYAAERENSYLLPMLHLRYDFTDWFDVRASYTETLSRPSYNLLVPSWTITNPRAFSWNNPALEPFEANNYDLTLSLYSSKVGLFTVAGFYKQIANFSYQRNTFVVTEDQMLEAYPEELELGATVTGYINNPNEATLYGAEVEWQSNFWFLPGSLSGLVFGVNYAYTFSELEYPRVAPVYERIPGTRIRRLVGGEVVPYTAPLLDQPDHSLNVTLGFDYEGFSIRGSMRRKSGIYSSETFIARERGFTDPLTLVDISVSQKLPVSGMSLFFNATNVTESIDTATNAGTGWYTNRHFYSWTGQGGVRYRL